MTHYYVLEGITSVLDNKESLKFNHNDYGGNIFEDLFENLKDINEFERAVETFTCRESLVESLSFMEDHRKSKGFKYSTGIRCYGEMFSKHTYKYLKRPSAAKSISKFIKEVFKVNVLLDYGIQKNNLPVAEYVECRDGKKINNGFVTIYFNPMEFNFEGSAVFISALLALLREQRIYSNIVNGKINSLKTLVSELISISYDRFLKKDYTYDYWGLVGSYGRTEKEVKTGILTVLSGDNSGEGSDWNSILKLGVYFMLNKSLGHSGNLSGPRNYAEDNASEKELKALHKLVGDKFLILCKACDEDDFFDMLTRESNG